MEWTLAVAMAAVMAQPTEALPQPQNEARVARNQHNTLLGPSGLLLVPNAYVAAPGTWQFGTSFGENTRSITLNWGATQGVELGGTFYDRERGRDKGFANAKVNIIPQNFRNFEIGIGVLDAVDAVDQTVYIVGSAYLTPGSTLENRALGLRVHLGTGTGFFQEKLIGGAEVIVDNRFSIVGEWDGRNTNGAIRFSPDDNFRIQLGIQHTNVFLGVTYGIRF